MYVALISRLQHSVPPSYINGIRALKNNAHILQMYSYMVIFPSLTFLSTYKVMETSRTHDLTWPGERICTLFLVYRLIGILKRFATLSWQMVFCFIIIHGY